ncbi:butyrophilin subfamily 3 member A3-like [Siniperca chuatsi]|uniref:butyrophilin subfamily 3 member A3-like n=1 Tax=Siniperca chuatsi TaxID=119488 RepID=UPI001CE1505D|nr:butyrophilin subfamily 3 member A3-like [Siniperca chuatsi]
MALSKARATQHHIREFAVVIQQESRMLHPNHESNHGESFRTFIGLHFLVLLMQPFGALLELICSHQPIVALVGDDVILRCYLEPPISASSETVVWTKPGLDPEYIHVHQDGRLLYQLQNPSYHNRTRLFVEELTNGNVSMKIFRVKISDAGKYFCFLPSIHEEASIQLTVGAVSTPIIEVTLNKSGSAVLQCESAGWYPEPEVFWLHGEGTLFSAGPTETVRGPDDLYTVSSRVTVVKGHGNNFICRVQQQNINQARETHIHVPADHFTVLSSFDSIWIIAIPFALVALLFIIITLIKNTTTIGWAAKKVSTDVPQRTPCSKLWETSGSPSSTSSRSKLILTDVVNGQLRCPKSRVEAAVGEDVTLECHIDPERDVTRGVFKLMVNQSERVLVYRGEGHDYFDDQHEQFKGRVSLESNSENLSKGEFVVKISSATTDDAGKYTCTTENHISCSIDLVIEPEENSIKGNQIDGGGDHNNTYVTGSGSVIGIVVVIVIIIVIVVAVVLCRRRTSQRQENNQNVALEQIVLTAPAESNG